MFVDEPTGSLDPAAGDECMEMRVDHARGQGASIPVVTHEPRIAAYADRTGLIRDAVEHVANGSSTPGRC